jgi:hypothetical protein
MTYDQLLELNKKLVESNRELTLRLMEVDRGKTPSAVTHLFGLPLEIIRDILDEKETLS